MRVLQLVDSLALGGLERVAVDLANLEAQERGSGLLCASRASGPLEAQLEDRVECLLLGRSGRWDLAAVRRLARWIDDRDVDLIHAHGSSLLLANLVIRRARCRPAIVWHDHYGRWATHPRPVWLYRMLTRRVDGVVAVNEPLRDWAVERLRLPKSRCRYVPNAVDCPAEPPARPRSGDDRALRLICVANLRPQKDHETLLRALSELSHCVDRPLRLLLVGGGSADRRNELERLAASLGLAEIVEFLGEQDDVPSLLGSADVGVLSSSSEGLPLALLEYGCAALPAVCTAVGQIPDVVGPILPDSEPGPVTRHEAGLLVPPGDATGFAAALERLIDDDELRHDLGHALHRRVRSRHGLNRFHEQVTELYGDILGRR